MGNEAFAGTIESVARRFFVLLVKISKFVSFGLLMVITGSVLAGVISRFVFNAAFSWSEELAVWNLFWLFSMAILTGHLENKHIHIDLFSSFLPKRLQQVKQFLVIIITSLSTLLVMSSGWGFFQKIGGLNVTLNISNSIKIAPLPIVCALSFIFIIGNNLSGRREFIARIVAVLVSVGMWILVDFGANMPNLPIQPSLLMMILFFVFVLLGAPITFSILLATFTATSSANLLPPPAVIQNMVSGGGKFILLAIPFFLSAGYLMNLGGLSSRILDFASTLVSHYTGGLAKVNVINSMLMGGISGSSGADAASDSKILVPEMIKRGYDPAFACAVTAGSAVLPNIIPPAITMLVMASVSDLSVIQLFVAGYGPGVLITILMLIVVHIISKRRHYEVGIAKSSMKQRWIAFVRALPSLLLIVWLVGSIRFGIVTATEAGVIGMIWAVFLGIGVYRACSWKELFAAMVECSIDTGLISLLIAVSSPFAWVLIADQVPLQLVTWASGLHLGQTGLLLLITGCLLVLGTFLDVSVTILIATPLFLPLAVASGIDPILFGIVLILGAIVGNLTPPVGILVYITSSITHVPPEKIFAEVIPMIIAILIGILLVILNPWICTGLWTLIG